MTDKEIMQMALDALEWCYDVTEWPANGKSAQDKAIEALRARLAQPKPEELGEIVPADEEQLKRIAKLVEPEPVAWLFQNEETGLTECVDIQQVEWGFEKNNPRWQKIAPLYTAPPQREWQWLTDAEVIKLGRLDKDSDYFGLWYDFGRAIEAKLKEKNG